MNSTYTRTDEHVELIDGQTVYSWREGGYFYAEFKAPCGERDWRVQADSAEGVRESIDVMLEFWKAVL